MGLQWEEGLELRSDLKPLSLDEWLDELANQLFQASRNNAVYITWTVDFATDVADRAREYAKDLRLDNDGEGDLSK